MPRSRHKGPPPWYTPKAEFISDRYWREVERDTNRLERKHRAAQQRLHQAKQRAQLADQRKETAAARSRYWREVEARTHELQEIEALMQPGNTASTRHRGTKSHTPRP